VVGTVPDCSAVIRLVGAVLPVGCRRLLYGAGRPVRRGDPVGAGTARTSRVGSSSVAAKAVRNVAFEWQE
jgi:hypothetical protein